MNDILVNIYLLVLVFLAIALVLMFVRAIAVAKRLGDLTPRDPSEPTAPPVEPAGPPHIGTAIEGVAEAVLALESALTVLDEYTVGRPHCVTLRFGDRLMHAHSPDCPASKLTAGGPNIRSESGEHSHPLPAVRRRPPTPSDLN